MLKTNKFIRNEVINLPKMDRLPNGVPAVLANAKEILKQQTLIMNARKLNNQDAMLEYVKKTFRVSNVENAENGSIVCMIEFKYRDYDLLPKIQISTGGILSVKSTLTVYLPCEDTRGERYWVTDHRW